MSPPGWYGEDDDEDEDVYLFTLSTGQVEQATGYPGWVIELTDRPPETLPATGER